MTQRTMDWRFFVALAGVLMVAYLVVGGYQDNVAKGDRIDRLIEAAEAQDLATAQASAEASRERQALLDNQDRLLRQARVQARRLADLEDRQARLLAYLEDLGIQVPPEFKQAPKRPASGKAGAEQLTPDRPGKSEATPRPKDQAATPADPEDQGLIGDLLDILHPERNTP